jgi:hypothetical protein
MVRVLLTRNSVAAGDDIDAPHKKRVTLADCDLATDLVDFIVAKGYLPKIVGGAATWVATSHEPFAVCAQQWSQCKPLKQPTRVSALKATDGAVRIHFSYLAQMDPEVVHRVLGDSTFVAP